MIPDFASSDVKVYAVYGTVMASRHPFAFHLQRCDAEPELWFELADESPLRAGWDAGRPRFDKREHSVGADMVSAVFDLSECLVARFGAHADYFIWPNRIVCHLHDPRYAFAVEIWLLGTVMALWLERRGIATLHAAAIEVGGQGVAFLATTKGGKSTLAAGMVLRGARLVTDDILPVEDLAGQIVGRPGYPQMRFWPEQARAILGSDVGLERVQPGSTKLRVPVGFAAFGRFQAHPVPMAALYLPEREPRATVVIEPVPLDHALVDLVRHSFLAGVMEALGMAPRRFRTFAALLQQAPVRRIRYPSGMDMLPIVCTAVHDDVMSLRD